MKFSLRAIFVLTFLVALGALAWTTRQRTERRQAEVQQIRSEIKNLQSSLHIDQPARQQAKRHELEQYQSLRAMRETAREQFGHLYQKYRRMEQREADVLSIRSLPALPTKTAPAPSIYRLLVPPERPVWLKFGVHPGHASSVSPSALDDLEFLTRSAFELTGPYEMRLPPGDHTISITSGPVREETLPLRIQFDDEPLLRTTLVAEGLSGSGSGRMTAPFQMDYGPQRSPPWLMNVRGHVEGSTAATCEVWLSDQSSHFQQFPGNENGA